jgi:hypothetical protein
MAMWQMAYGAGAPIGILIQGALMSTIGVRPVLALDAVVLAPFCLVVARRSMPLHEGVQAATVATATG